MPPWNPRHCRRFQARQRLFSPWNRAKPRVPPPKEPKWANSRDIPPCTPGAPPWGIGQPRGDLGRATSLLFQNPDNPSLTAMPFRLRPQGFQHPPDGQTSEPIPRRLPMPIGSHCPNRNAPGDSVRPPIELRERPFGKNPQSLPHNVGRTAGVVRHWGRTRRIHPMERQAGERPGPPR